MCPSRTHGLGLLWCGIVDVQDDILHKDGKASHISTIICYNHLCANKQLWCRSGKGFTVSDFEAQILELLLQLSQDQQLAALDFLRLLTEGVQEISPVAQAKDSQQDE